MQRCYAGGKAPPAGAFGEILEGTGRRCRDAPAGFYYVPDCALYTGGFDCTAGACAPVQRAGKRLGKCVAVCWQWASAVYAGNDAACGWPGLVPEGEKAGLAYGKSSPAVPAVHGVMAAAANSQPLQGNKKMGRNTAHRQRGVPQRRAGKAFPNAADTLTGVNIMMKTGIFI